MSCDDSETVDAFVGCINAEYGTDFPREADIPPDCTLHALYASPIARFARKPGYTYWGEIDRPWTVFSEPSSLVVTTAVVYVPGPTPERPRLRSRLRALVRGRPGRNRSSKGAAR